MNLGTLQQTLTTALCGIYPENEAAIICDWVMAYHTGISKMERRLFASNTLPEATIRAVQSAQEKLLQHMPVQYVLEEAWFMGLPFFVNEHVLIPRPETEELVALMTTSCRVQSSQQTSLTILDIGTGSGCIPITLKKQWPQAQVTAIDVSHEALLVALKNAQSHHVTINFTLLDFLEESQWQKLPAFDIIVSNPPYIPLAEKTKLDLHVTDWEPGTALFVPDNDALLFYKKIALFGKTHLTKGGRILMETHQDYALATQQMFEENGYQTTVHQDINGNDRMVMAWGIKRTL